MFEGRERHLVLILEVSVDAALGQARGFGEVGQGGPGVALHVEDGGSFFDDEKASSVCLAHAWNIPISIFRVKPPDRKAAGRRLLPRRLVVQFRYAGPL